MFQEKEKRLLQEQLINELQSYLIAYGFLIILNMLK
jgi:hypothetical protein